MNSTPKHIPADSRRHLSDSRSALLVVDYQNDFCPGGALAVPEGDLITDTINMLMKQHEVVAATQDWHPRGHISFATAHPGEELFSVIEADGFPQTLWPDHCIAGTKGAALHPDLDTAGIDLILRKGTSQHLDSYSAFFENDRRTPTGLHGYFRERQISSITVCGLALDVCVYFTALDAVRLGYTVTIPLSASRGVDVPEGRTAEAVEELKQQGVRIV